MLTRSLKYYENFCGLARRTTKVAAHPVLSLLCWALLTSVAADAEPAAPSLSMVDYRDAPVFYELRGDEEGDRFDRSEVRRGRIALPPYETVRLPEFDWKMRADLEQDRSWWIQIEELKFLLPLIGSDESDDHKIARRWFLHWDAAHKSPEPPNSGALYPMSVALRAMVLVHFLKQEERRSDVDTTLARILRERILEHQALLVREEFYEGDSNHGLVEGFALLETTRVGARADYVALGLERMLDVTRLSVSMLGSHMEGAAGYHFVFLRWLDEYTTYLQQCSSGGSEQIDELDRYRESMRRVAYYFQDRSGNKLPIGDSSVNPIDVNYRFEHPVDNSATLYDPEAGFAIYKPDPRGGDLRHVVLRIQNQRSKFSAHHHDDALSVFFSYAGETILGDQGAYKYSFSRERAYFISMRAHNTVFPKHLMKFQRTRGFTLATPGPLDTGAGGTEFSGEVIRRYSRFLRQVRMAKGEPGIVVLDTITPTGDNVRSSHPIPRITQVMTWNIGPAVVEVRELPSEEPDRFQWSLTTERRREFRMTVDLSGGFDRAASRPDVLRGQKEPLMGWYSPAFGTMVPSTVIVLTLVPRSPALVVTTRVELVGSAE